MSALVYLDVFLAGMLVGIVVAALYWRPQRWVKTRGGASSGGETTC